MSDTEERADATERAGAAASAPAEAQAAAQEERADAGSNAGDDGDGDEQAPAQDAQGQKGFVDIVSRADGELGLYFGRSHSR